MFLTYLFIYFVIFYYGACFASFANAYAYRYANGIKITKGRSFCEECGYTLSILDLLPIFSYIALRGKCRKCKNKISAQYFCSEVVGGLLCVTTFLILGINLGSILVSFVAVTLLALSLVDIKTMEIPNAIQIILIILSILSYWVLPYNLSSRVLGVFSISVPMIITNLFIKDAFGGGDIKLMAICGFMIGFANSILSMFIAVILAGAYGAFIMFKGVKGKHMPFGPFLAVGLYVSLIYGHDIIKIYLNACGITI